MPFTLRSHLAALRALLVLTVVLGLAYPLAVTALAQIAMPAKANGSLVQADGHVLGSALLGQSTSDARGNPLPQWFQPRPSAAGKDGYDALSSGASNLGPTSSDLLRTVQQRRAEVAAFNGVPAGQVPADAVTASGSGLDPDISPAYAYLQVDRVARARGLDAQRVRGLVAAHVQGRDLGVLGEPTVNVLQLNLALAALRPAG